MKTFRFLVILMTLCASGFAQSPGKYAKYFSEDSLRDTIRFISDDGFGGRAPGSPGGELAAKYIAQRLKSIGVKPANMGSYFQAVPLVGLKPDPDTKMNISRPADGETFSFEFGKDFVAFTDAQKDNVSVTGDLIFVGYGIDAPEQNWNDYKGDRSQYKDKILVMLVNDPPATASEPNLFGGKALTYYGRWTYKFEEAARKGAKGVILVHTTESAGYGWNVVESSFGGTERFDISRSSTDKSPFLQMKAWMKDSSVGEFIKFSGTTLAALTESAKSRDFVPVPLGTEISIDLKAKLNRVDSNNVVGVLEGRDPNLKSEFVVYSAHWDHLGIGKPDSRGDAIYNGATDNASGIAQVLGLAEAFASLPKLMQPRRSQVFLFVTAEEQGLLGSEFYARNPIFPIAKTAANINIDGGNFYGKTTDFGALGANRSSLEEVVNATLRARGMTFAPDTHPEKGFFFRSDHFPFAKAGVPALSIGSGEKYVGKPADFSQKVGGEFVAKNYHQPSDEFNEAWVFDGMVQMLDIVMDIGLQTSNSPQMPEYKKGDEFARKR